MNTKELIAAEIAKVVPELEQENIQNLLETPKNADMGDLAFPAFSLAKVLRKAPQMIAADIAEKLMPQTLKKLKVLLVLILTSSSINQKFQRTFLDKSSLKVATTLTKTSVTDVILPLICLVLTSPNLFSMVTCVQRLSLMLLANIVAKQGYKPVRINQLGRLG